MADRDREGYILIDRNILDWRWAKTPNTAYLFILMILKANYKDLQFKNRIIKRGQFVTSLKSLCNTSGLRFQEVRTAISHLKSTNEITIETTNQYSVITIVNYDNYQKATNETTRKSTIKQQTTNKQLTTSKYKEYKEYKKRNNKGRSAPESPSGEKQMPGREEGTIDDIPLKHRDGTLNSFSAYAEYWDWRNQ